MNWTSIPPEDRLTENAIRRLPISTSPSSLLVVAGRNIGTLLIKLIVDSPIEGTREGLVDNVTHWRPLGIRQAQYFHPQGTHHQAYRCPYRTLSVHGVSSEKGMQKKIGSLLQQ